MERKERKSLDGTKVISGCFEWRFTGEEKEKIKDALQLTETKKKRKIASEHNMDRFIRHLEFLCDGRKRLFDQPNREVTRLNRKQVLSSCKKTLDHLKKIEQCKMILWHSDSMASYGKGDKVYDPVSNFICDSFEAAWAAVGPLEKFIKLLDQYHRKEKKKVGRPSADADHFVERIREIYIEHIGKPSVTDTGPFSRVVSAVLEILGEPHKDPSRAVKSTNKK